MSKTIRIKSNAEIYAIQVILEGALEEHGDVDVVIKKHKNDLSGQQRKLYWMWIGILADNFGNEKDEFHVEMKKKFLVGIYCEHHDGFSDMVAAVRKVQHDDEETWRTLSAHIIKNISITDANVSEMREYLNLIDRFAVDNGVRLPLPADQGMDLKVYKR